MQPLYQKLRVELNYSREGISWSIFDVTSAYKNTGDRRCLLIVMVWYLSRNG